jgi:predicted nucleic acid-binding protein
MIFVDTSFLVAGLSRRDDHHRDAVLLRDRLADAELLTTNHVVGESWTFTRRRYGHTVAASLLSGLRARGRIEVHHVEADAEERATAWLLRHDEREYSFVDATSFETMRALGITEALSFDADFGAAGFETLRA